MLARSPRASDFSLIQDDHTSDKLPTLIQDHDAGHIIAIESSPSEKSSAEHTIRLAGFLARCPCLYTSRMGQSKMKCLNLAIGDRLRPPTGLQLTVWEMLRSLRLRVPKPRRCLGFVDLQTAVEVITIFTLINKVSGFYGILSLLTGQRIKSVLLLTPRRLHFCLADKHVYLVCFGDYCVLMGLQANP
jgi:Inositolphosphorylceramide synthase subunit Kei1